MTRDRMFGSDVPFCAWMRANKVLPSYSRDCGFVASDVDLFIHRYLVDLKDKQGSRDFQCLMTVELKTRLGVVHESQADTLWKLHKFRGQLAKPLWCEKRKHHYELRNFGVYFLRMSGEDPKESGIMKWGRFDKDRPTIRWDDVDVDKLVRILRFDISPESLEGNWWRRHHKTQEIVTLEQQPLGFAKPVRTIKRS